MDSSRTDDVARNHDFKNRFLKPFAGLVAISLLFIGVVQVTMNWMAVFGVTVLVLPGFLLGAVSAAFAFWWSGLRYGAGVAAAFVACLITLAALLLLGLEGLLAVVAMTPLLAALAAVGASAAYVASRWYRAHGRAAVASAVLLTCTPFFAGLEGQIQSGPKLRTISTEIVMDASRQDIWDQIATTTTLREPDHWFFRWGAGYPMHIDVEGEGVGSWRLDEFPTGVYELVVTEWDEPERMAFSVAAQPIPLNNINPFHGELRQPRLEEGVYSKRGEFHLRETDDGVVVRATSWYYNAMVPNFYWGGIVDRIIQQMHLLILEDIEEGLEERRAAEA